MLMVGYHTYSGNTGTLPLGMVGYHRGVLNLTGSWLIVMPLDKRRELCHVHAVFHSLYIGAST